MFIRYSGGKKHPTQEGWVLLGVYNPIEIHVVDGLLRSNGIETLIEGEVIADILGLTVGPIGEKLLFVRREDYNDAIRLVEVKK